MDPIEAWKALLSSYPVLNFLDPHIVAEILLVGVIVYLLLQKSYKPKRHDKLTEKEVDQLIEEWTPEPLVPASASKPLPHIPVVSDVKGGSIVVDGKKAVNAATFDFLAVIGDKKVESECDRTLAKYGCGSCGPRGFYGTIDVHLNLEKEIASFLGTHSTIIYSYDIATVSSVIPAFAKRGDLILFDEEVSFPIQQGLYLSRAVTRGFKHNNTTDLERLMLAVHKQDTDHPPKQLNRRFVAIEGIYSRTGLLSPLKDIVALCKKYKYRLILDESISFGTLGKTGRGATEHWGVAVSDVDMLTASMSNALGSIGGFCAGGEQVVDHQRLSGLGYCFSASLPPFNSVAASTALQIIRDQPQRIATLQKNARLMREAANAALESAHVKHGAIAKILGDASSPMFLVQLVEERRLSQEEDEDLMREVARVGVDQFGVAAAVVACTPLEKPLATATLRVCASSAHSEAEAKLVGSKIVESLVAVVAPARPLRR